MSIVGDISTYKTGENGTTTKLVVMVKHLDSAASQATTVNVTLSDYSEAVIGSIASSVADAAAWVLAEDGDLLLVSCTSSTNLTITLDGVDDLVDDGDIEYIIDVDSGIRLTNQSAYGSAGDVLASLSFVLDGLNVDNDTSGK